MKRTLKNFIMIFIIILLVGSIAMTSYYAKNHLSSSETQTATPPSMPNNEKNQSSSSGSSSQMTPPEKPDNDTSNSETSSNASNSENSQSTSSGSSNQMTPGNESGGTPPSMPNNGNSQNTSSNKITIVYYVMFGIESLLIALIVMYLILSKFNKKTLKETFNSKDRVLIYILSMMILTAGLTFGSSFITNKFVLSSSNNDAFNNNANQSTNISYSASKEITKSTTIESGNFESSKSDENAILLNGNIEANLSNIEVTKIGDSDGGDNTSFYGTNSAILAKSGANVTLKNIKVTTNATGANGVFSYGGSATTSNSSSDGTTVNISDSTITTSKDNSGGIMTTGGGVMNANNLTITTAGTSSAAIRSDRGGGTVTVDGGTYKTTGQGSPTIYSTANITVKNADLVATASEGVIIEGKNSVTLENVTLTDTNNKLNGQSTTYKNLFLYQSMSGDADTGKSLLTAKNSKIVTNKGDTIYVTNTSSTIKLTNNEIINNDSSGNFLRVKADSWGNSGSNGGDVTLVMTKQTADGNIVIDSISTLDMTLKKASSYKGTINGENTAKSIKLKLDASSKITLTGDSYVSSLEDADSTYSNIDFNGYKLYVNGKSIN